MEPPRPFSELLRARHAELWGEPSDIHSAATCQRTPVGERDDDPRRRCCRLWQRKLSDKLQSKVFARAMGVPVADVLWTGDDPSRIPFEALPRAYVVKCSFGHSSEQVVPVLDGRSVFDGSEVSPSGIVSFFRALLARGAHGTCYVESFVAPEERIPTSLSCYVFHGRTAFIERLSHGASRAGRSQRWYDRDWNAVGDEMRVTGAPQTVVAAPAGLSAVLSWSDRLGSGYEYPFVRVDFLLDAERACFGEFEPTPSLGRGFTPHADDALGRLCTSGS